MIDNIFNIITLYIFVTCITRCMIWIISMLVNAILSYLVDILFGIFTKFSQFVILERDSYPKSVHKYCLKVLYFLKKISIFIDCNENRMRTKSNMFLLSLIRTNILKLDLLNFLLIGLSIVLIESNMEIDKSVRILIELYSYLEKMLIITIESNKEKVKYVILAIVGIWIFKIGAEWTKLKQIAKEDLLIKNKIMEIYSTFSSNCELLYQIKYNVVTNCKISLTDNIGYDFYDGQLVQSNRFITEKEKEISVKAVGKNIAELIDILENSLKYKETGVRRTYSSLYYLMIDELYSLNSIVYIENSVLHYAKRDVNYQFINDYFRNYHNQIYKHEFTYARVINSDPLKNLDFMKEKAAEYLVEMDKKSEKLIWKYIILKEAFSIEVTKYLKNRRIFFEFNRYLFSFHIDKLICVLRFIY